MVEIITAVYFCKTTCDVAHGWPGCLYLLWLLVCLNGSAISYIVENITHHDWGMQKAYYPLWLLLTTGLVVFLFNEKVLP